MYKIRENTDPTRGNCWEIYRTHDDVPRFWWHGSKKKGEEIVNHLNSKRWQRKG